jgi:hypothetical protein
LLTAKCKQGWLDGLITENASLLWKQFMVFWFLEQAAGENWGENSSDCAWQFTVI